MSYLGEKPAQTLAAPTSQYFNGDGSTVAFTLNRAVNVAEDLDVFVNNVRQEPGVGKSYTATGTTLTFDAAPSSGTANVYVVYRGLAEVTTRLEHDPNAALAATTGTFSGDLTVDTNTLYVDSTNNRVGVGTSSPATALDVTGTVTADGATIDGAKVLVQRANDDSTIVFANNASGTPSSHAWAAGLDYSNSNAFTVAYGNTGIPSLTGQPKLVVDTSGNLTVTGNISASGGLGKVLQVVANYDSSTYNLSTSGYFGPSVTITPSSTSSKLLILVMYSVGNSNNNGGVKILQNGSNFMPDLPSAYVGGASSYGGAFNTSDDSWGSSTAYTIVPVHVQYLHSPSSTSALTYRGYWHSGSGGNLRLNRQEIDNGGRGFSHMTVMEIAG